MRPLLRMGVAGAALAAGAFWYFNYFALPKRTYNGVHPYTSFIAIFVYLVLRNITPGLRRLHLHFFAWCGKITLETYILQFHIWMKTTGLNSSPKYLMVWLPNYYWVNFLVISAAYVFISYRVFIITAGLKDVVIPKEVRAPPSSPRHTRRVAASLIRSLSVSAHCPLAVHSLPPVTSARAHAWRRAAQRSRGVASLWPPSLPASTLSASASPPPWTSRRCLLRQRPRPP